MAGTELTATDEAIAYQMLSGELTGDEAVVQAIAAARAKSR